jgi:hypothetical protein
VCNHWKDKLVSDNLGIWNFQSCHGEILPKDHFMLKGQFCSEFTIQQPGQFPIVVTHKPLTGSSWKMNDRKAERVT